MRRMQGREHWLIPILMTLFAAGGTTYGMAEETLAFYAILIPAVIAIGYDTVTGVAIILIGASVGVLGSTINPQRGRDPFHPRLWLCFVLLLGSLTLSIGYVMRYAARVKAHPSHSVVAHLKASNEARFLAGREPGAPRPVDRHPQGGAGALRLIFAVMIWGVSSQGWWMAEMGALSIAAALLIGTVAWLGDQPETLLVEAVYAHHPRFAGQTRIWWGGGTCDWGKATLEGGDIMPVAPGRVMIGMGERSTPQGGRPARARALRRGRRRARSGLRDAEVARLDASRHGLTLCGGDVATSFAEVASQIRCLSLRPGEREGAVDVREEEGALDEVAAAAAATA